MFYLVVLGVAAAIAPGCTDEEFYFNEVYTVTAEYLNSPWIIRQWYDQVIGNSRLDLNDERWEQVVFEMPTNSHPYGRVKMITTFTTETHFNMKRCTIYEGSKKNAFLALDTVLPKQDFWSYIGDEMLHGELAKKFHKRISEYTNDTLIFKMDFYFWTVIKELHGKMEYVPIKQEIYTRDLRRGIYLFDSVVYTDYDTAPIDSGIFLIDAGLQCDQRNLSESDKAFDELPTLPFRNKFSKLSNHQNQYRNEEELKLRQEIVESNRKMIEEHNHGDHSYKMEANHLIDRTEEEIAAMGGRFPTKGPRKGQPFPYSDAQIEALSAELPEQFDWRLYGAVTPVKDQVLCFSSWAFGAIGAVEGALFLKNKGKRLVTLSEQALLDCSWGFQNKGCHGGNEEGAFEYMMRHGIANDAHYGEYREMMKKLLKNFYGRTVLSTDSTKIYMPGSTRCHMDKTPIEATIEAYFNITQNEKAIKVALLKHGPISVAMHVCKEMTFYSGGVFDAPNCKGELNHAATLVGYGVLDGKSYWLIKNCWGEQWAANGYLLVAIESNICNVMDEANFVTLK